MKVIVCIGSSCHIKGSRQIVEGLQYYIREANLGDKVELGGTFCMGKCQQGVCVTVDDRFYSVSPDTLKDFFEKEIKAKVKQLESATHKKQSKVLSIQAVNDLFGIETENDNLADACCIGWYVVNNIPIKIKEKTL